MNNVVKLHQVAQDTRAHLLLNRNGDLVPITHIRYFSSSGTYELTLLQNSNEFTVNCTGRQEVVKVTHGEYANRTLWHVRPH